MLYTISSSPIHMSPRMSLRKRLLPIRKAWKKFTARMQTKFHKLHKSKPIKKRTFSLYFPLQRKRRLLKPSLTLHPHYYKRYVLQKRAAPVYIDDLFKSEFGAATPTVITGRKIDVDDVKTNMVAGTSQESEKPRVGDDLSRSVGLASPQMLGIDERADDFIARFRAEMRRQERMERNL